MSTSSVFWREKREPRMSISALAVSREVMQGIPRTWPAGGALYSFSCNRRLGDWDHIISNFEVIFPLTVSQHYYYFVRSAEFRYLIFRNRDIIIISRRRT
jgi:hypothetical protein